VVVGKRMMRPEESTKEGDRLPPLELILSAGSKGNVLDPQNQRVENTKRVKEKKGRKNLEIPERVVEEMDIEGGEEDFGIDQRTEVVVEMHLRLAWKTGGWGNRGTCRGPDIDLSARYIIGQNGNGERIRSACTGDRT